MTPFTPEQIEALAERIEARAMMMTDWRQRKTAMHLLRLAQDIRDGTFIEVQPHAPEPGQ